MSAFISYSHHDRTLARRLSRVLTEFGLEHWWDDALALSTPWNAVLEQRLRSASSIVVLWTPKSSNSEWVHREARMGADVAKLVQLRFGEASLPAEFAALQAAEVPNWEENTHPRGIRRALNEVARLQQRDPVLQEHLRMRGLVISDSRVTKFIDGKKHHEGYFPKLDGPLYKDIWEMQMSGQIKLYDELRLGSRHSVDEERYYELLEYLSDASGRRSP